MLDREGKNVRDWSGNDGCSQFDEPAGQLIWSSCGGF